MAIFLSVLAIQGILVLDQWVKFWAIDVLKPVGTMSFLDGVLGFCYVENTGAAFGSFANQRWLFISVTLVLVLVAQYLLFTGKLKRPIEYVIATFIIGGGIGNLIDRIARGYVVDMFNFEFMNFAVFNVADVFVTVGAALLLVYVIASEALDYRKKKAPAGDGALAAPDAPPAGEEKETPAGRRRAARRSKTQPETAGPSPVKGEETDRADAAKPETQPQDGAPEEAAPSGEDAAGGQQDTHDA